MEIHITESLTWKDLTAIYAALVSTSVAIISYVKYRRDIRNKLAVRFFVQSRAFSYPNRIGEWFRVFAIKVVNHSFATKYFTQPSFQVNNVSQQFVAINIENPVNYPVKLESGQVWEIAIDFDSIKDTLIKAKSKKCRVIVTDTLGKSFKSKWLKVMDL